MYKLSMDTYDEPIKCQSQAYCHGNASDAFHSDREKENTPS